MFDEVKYLTYLNDKELMEYNVADILERKDEYHSFHNGECAKATYDYLLSRCPDAMFFECCGGQFICATNKAVAKLHSKLDERKNSLEADLKAVAKLLSKLDERRNSLEADLSDVTNVNKNIENSMTK